MKIFATPVDANRALNPYTFLLYQHVRKLGVSVTEFSPRTPIWSLKNADIWHIHWPESEANRPNILLAIIGSIRVLLAIVLCRLYGVKIVWTVHNIEPHEKTRKFLKGLVSRAVRHCVSALIFLSHSSHRDSERVFGDTSKIPCRIIPHGHYRDVYPKEINRVDARLRLGLDEQGTVMLFFGQIRPYKNVPQLIKAFARLENDELRLVVAGSTGNCTELSSLIGELSNKDRRVIFVDVFLSDEQLALWICAADLVVLPFRDITNSGSVFLALSYGRRILASNKGAMAEIQRCVGKEWMMLFDGDVNAEILRKALVEKNLAVSQSTRPDLSEFDWQKIAERTVGLYRDITRK